MYAKMKNSHKKKVVASNIDNKKLVPIEINAIFNLLLAAYRTI